MAAYEWIDCGDGRSVYRKKDVFVPNNFGTAPMVIFDSMPAEYHHGVCRTIESRKEWDAADRESGSATLSPQEFKRKSRQRKSIFKAQQREIQKDRRKASEEMLRAYKENPTEVEAALQFRAEQQEQVIKDSGLKNEVQEAIDERRK